MINLNGVYFDKIRIVKIIECYKSEEREYMPHGGFITTKWREWFDVKVNGEKLGLELDKDKAEQWIKENIL